MKIFNADCLEILKKGTVNSVDALVTDPPAGISFMNKDWDDDKGGRDGWISWLTEVMCEAHRVMKPGAHGLVWAIPRTSHWTATALENAGFEIRDVVTHLFGTGFPKSLDISKAIDKAAGAKRKVIGSYKSPENTTGLASKNDSFGYGMGDMSKRLITAPATEASKQWCGWGTTLKPASEHWILIRKPCSEKTVSANVLKWGVGGLNIDDCRIGTERRKVKASASNADANHTMGTFKPWNGEYKVVAGRFPANLVLDEGAAATLDEQANASVSRFFYVAKASTSEKNTGLDGMSDTTISDGGQTTIDNPHPRPETPRENTHPTVKSIKLMEYLIKLITPPEGKVLDPFMGSGSTGIAAIQLGFDFIGIEQNKEYFEIAKLRLNLK